MKCRNPMTKCWKFNPGNKNEKKKSNTHIIS